MRIITLAPSGALQSWDTRYPIPDGAAVWPDDLDDSTFYEYSGIVSLQVSDGVVVSYEPDLERWEAAQAAWKQLESEEQPTPVPALESRVTALEESVAALNIVLTGEGPEE